MGNSYVMMGVIAAGSGMCAYMTRHGLGTGPNLSCTVLYLTLLQLVEDGRPLGAHIHVLLDNTTGDNKNNDVIFFLAWLVETRVCDEASFFVCWLATYILRGPSTHSLGNCVVWPLGVCNSCSHASSWVHIMCDS